MAAPCTMKGHEVQAILSSANHDSLPTPQDWEFEVLTKKVVFHAHHWGSTTTTPDTTTIPEPSIHTLTSHLETKGVLTPKTKGVTLPNDHKRSVKRNVARSKTTHKRAKIETKASMDYSDLVPDNSKAPYQQTEMNGANRRRRLTKPFKTKGGPKGDQSYLRDSSKHVQTPKHLI